MTDKPKCSGRVFGNYRFHNCPRAGVVEINGKPYCRQHDPTQIRVRKETRDARWAAESALHSARWEVERIGAEIVSAVRRSPHIETDLRDRLLAADTEVERCRDALAELTKKRARKVVKR